MRLVRLRSLLKSLPLWLGLVFAVQVAVAVPQHAFHSAEHAAAASHGGDKAPSLPDDCRCDLCLAMSGLDSASAVPPPVPGLAETAFAVVAAYASFEYEHPDFFAQARGPPVALA